MKRKLTMVILAISMVATLMTGCGDKNNVETVEDVIIADDSEKEEKDVDKDKTADKTAENTDEKNDVHELPDFTDSKESKNEADTDKTVSDTDVSFDFEEGQEVDITSIVNPDDYKDNILIRTKITIPDSEYNFEMALGNAGDESVIEIYSTVGGQNAKLVMVSAETKNYMYTCQMDSEKYFTFDNSDDDSGDATDMINTEGGIDDMANPENKCYYEGSTDTYYIFRVCDTDDVELLMYIDKMTGRIVKIEQETPSDDNTLAVVTIEELDMDYYLSTYCDDNAEEISSDDAAMTLFGMMMSGVLTGLDDSETEETESEN